MNTLIERNIITEVDCGSNYSFILSSNDIFLSTEYKVLQSPANSFFVKCMKMLNNGKLQLFYLTHSLKPLASLLPSLDAGNFLTIIANLFSCVIDVKHNGFLSCRNIDISFDHIFVDPTTHKVSLVYLPINERIYDDNSSFENELRAKLVKLISEHSSLSTPKVNQLAANLSDGTLSIEDLLNNIKDGKITSTPTASKSIAGSLRFIAINAPTHVEIPITKNEFILGKKAELCDGVITFNNMISRTHCKINKDGNKYTISDLQSANGTFVNKVRLQPNQPYPISNGDIVRLANSDFQISIQ